MHGSDLFEEVQFDNADLKRRYDHYNALLFDGKLPEIPVEYAKLKSVGGVVHVRLRTFRRPGMPMRFARREMVPGSMRLQMSTFYQREPQALDGLLLHEMVHVHFFSIGDFNESHGPNFVAMCRELSKRVGFEVPLTDDVTGLMMTDAPKRKVGVIIVTKKDGKLSVAVVSEAYVRQNLEALRARWGFLSQFAQKLQIIVTIGRIEGRYPVQRKEPRALSFYRVDEPELIKEAMEHAEVLATIEA